MTGKARPAPTVVFLHGLGGSRVDWDEAIARLGGALDGVALDLPGAGDAEKPGDGYDPSSLARWLLDTLRHHGLEKVALVGHSLGARVAGELAAAAPTRVSSLVLVSPLGAVPYSLVEKLKWKGMSRHAILTSVPEAQMRSATGYGFVKSGKGKSGFVERAMAARTGREASAVTRAVEKSVDGVLSAPPLSERLSGTKLPLLLVAGAQDPLAPPETTRSLLKARPDARFVELPGIGHYPMLEDPAGLAKVLKDFLRS
jgi:pimeloyl-ACP methyl ester carboxylesterase